MSVRAILLVVFAAVLVAIGYYVRDLQDSLKDDKAVITQVATNQKTERIDDGTIAIEAKTYEDAILQPVVAPVVRMCIAAAPRPVLPAGQPGSLPHAQAPGAEPDQPNFIQGPDIGRPLVTIGRDADAQIAGLQDYITNVCRPKP